MTLFHTSRWEVQRLFGLTFTAVTQTANCELGENSHTVAEVAHVRQVARQTPGLELEPPDAKRTKRQLKDVERLLAALSLQQSSKT